MGRIQLNPHKQRVCAFCVNWYDPANTAIKPAAPNIGLWEYDTRARSKCLMRNMEKEAGGICNNYRCKV